MTESLAWWGYNLGGEEEGVGVWEEEGGWTSVFG